MNENREIEEMARKIDYAINHECKLNNGGSCEDCQYDNNGDWNCQSQMMATYLQGEGYRNVKDKVVLDKEEYQNDFSSQFNKGYEKGRKETAREIFGTIIKALEEKKERVKAFYGVAESVGADVAIRTIKKLAEEHGVGWSNGKY